MIAKSDFRRMMQENFDIAWRIMSNLAERLRTADRKIESLALMDVYGRVARLLLEMAEEVEGERIVQRKISKQDIAKMIGASREMVSRVMKDLGMRGLIEDPIGHHPARAHSRSLIFGERWALSSRLTGQGSFAVLTYNRGLL